MFKGWNSYVTDKFDHGYDVLYDRYFNNIRTSTGNILEIGSRRGSTQLWRDYFPNATIISADIAEHNTTNINNVWGIPNAIGYRFDQSSENDHLKLIESFKNFDIIIDDGPHRSYEQILSLRLLFPYLNKGGIYVIEDLHNTDPDSDPYVTPYCGTLNFSVNVQTVLKDFQNSIYTNYDFIDFNSFSDFDFHTHVDRTSKKRWSHMHKPTEIAFLIKK
jgi:hypothetical protein